MEKTLARALTCSLRTSNKSTETDVVLWPAPQPLDLPDKSLSRTLAPTLIHAEYAEAKERRMNHCSTPANAAGVSSTFTRTA